MAQFAKFALRTNLILLAVRASETLGCTKARHYMSPLGARCLLVKCSSSGRQNVSAWPLPGTGHHRAQSIHRFRPGVGGYEAFW